MVNLLPELLLPFILYAETHYKFKGVYSRLNKNEPEIVADAPIRVEPDQPVPILLLIKDAHRFPIQLEQVIVQIKKNSQVLGEHRYSLFMSIANERFWHRLFYIDKPKDYYGTVEIDVQFVIKVNGKRKGYHNDNYRISTHQPLSVYLAAEPLPRFDDWYFGDFHYHSNYTEDQVEFGAPIAATVAMARAMGLSFFAVTDHSYDLDDREDSWLENDRQLPKWHRMWQEISRLNQRYSDFLILPGEEVSAGNYQNRNVHLLILNDQNFYPGKGDSAEEWFRTMPDLSIEQVLDQLSDEALAIAGHPEIPTPFLQWLLIRRGRWGWQDFQHDRLDGFQIWNGEYDHSFYHGSEAWTKLLLAGKKLSLIAGNDAHGNFNRFRQIGFPFFTLRESRSQLFGNMRTGVKINRAFDIQHLIQAVKKNRTLVSNGPVMEITIKNEQGQFASIGDEITGQQLNLAITAKSAEEFGRLESIKIFRGNLIDKTETLEKIIDYFPDSFIFEMEQKVPDVSSPTYFRAELTAKKQDGNLTRCLTNPIWIDLNG